MSSEMKRTLCNELLEKGLVSEGDVIRHSYTRNRLDNGVENMGRTQNKDKLCPTLDTRSDCFGVVVKEPTELQKEVCNQAIENGMMTPYDIIDYTYSNARLDEIKQGKLKTKNSMDNQIANTITTNAENMGVCVPDKVNENGVINPLKGKTAYGWHFEQQVYDPEGLARTIKAGGGSGNIPKVIVDEPKINTIGNYSPSGHEASRIVSPDGLAPTVKENHGTVTATVVPNVIGGVGEKKSNGGRQWYQQDRIYDDGCAISVTTAFNPYYATEKQPLRIRKLTPKECWRLMGFDDEDFHKAEKVCSNSQLYKQAGNSIVVNVLMAIFKELFVSKQTRSEWLDELLN